MLRNEDADADDAASLYVPEDVDAEDAFAKDATRTSITAAVAALVVDDVAALNGRCFCPG